MILALLLALVPQDIVFLVADDLSPVDLEAIDTPHLDSLKAQSVSFERAYSMPTCSPTRWAVQYGTWNPRHFRSACRDNPANPFPHPLAAPILDPSRPSLPSVLVDAGYSTGLFGKWHRGAVLAGWQNAPAALGYGAWRCMTSASLAALAGPCDSSGYYDYQRSDDGILTQGTTWATLATTDATIGWAIATPSPRFASVNFNAPHTPHELPPGETGTTERELFESMVRDMDLRIGSVLNRVPSSAWVFFFADNGTYSGVSTTPGKAKRTTFEGGIRVPLFVRGPGVPQGETCRQLVSLVDLLATVCDITDQTKPVEADDSVSFLPLALDPCGPATRSIAYAGHVRDDGTEHDQATFTTRWKLRKVFGVEELYDLHNDPAEVNPLPAVGPMADALRAFMASAPQ